MPGIRQLLVTVTFATFLPTIAAAQVVEIYVKAGASAGGANGTSWSSAFPSLQTGLDAAVQSGADEILVYVAQGTYKPAASGPTARSKSFTIPEGTTIRGGYEGLAGTPGPQNPEAFPTMLSGDINGDDDYNAVPTDAMLDDNSYHVVRAIGRGERSGLNGLVIQGGYTFGEPQQPVPFQCTEGPCAGLAIAAPGGAGLIAVDCTEQFLVRDCVFRFNRATLGGAVRLMCGNPTVLHCRFEENSATGLVDIDADPTNGADLGAMEESGNGGAIWATGCCDAKIHDCAFVRNVSGHVGGAVAVQKNSDADIVNCVFWENGSHGDGGGLRIGNESGVHVLNSTFYENLARCGGGIATGPEGDPNPGRQMLLCNLIAWGNARYSGGLCGSGTGAGDNIALKIESNGQTLGPVVIDISDIGGGQSGIFISAPSPSDPTFYPLTYRARNIDADPLFVDGANPDGNDDVLGNVDDGLRLSYASLCLNLGDSVDLPVDLHDADDDMDDDEALPDVTLLDRTIHPSGLCVDAGSYENQVSSCFGDIWGASGVPDGTVDGTDLAFLLGRWGGSGGVADLVVTTGDPTEAAWCTDNAVDSSDLSALLSAWGSCGQSMMAASNGAGEESGPPAPAELAEQMGFASVDELVEWAVGLGPEAMAAWFELIYGGSGGA